MNNENTQNFLRELDQTLWKSADKLRNNLDAANYKHIVLGFIFLNTFLTVSPPIVSISKPNLATQITNST